MMEAGALRGATMRHARVVDDAFTRAVACDRRALAEFAFTLCGDARHAEDVSSRRTPACGLSGGEAGSTTWLRIFGVRSPTRCTSGTDAGSSSGRGAARPPDRRADGRFEAQVDDRDALWAGTGPPVAQQRVVVVLRIVEDLSEEQTATMLGVPVGTVKSGLSRALAVLCATLEDDRG